MPPAAKYEAPPRHTNGVDAVTVWLTIFAVLVFITAHAFHIATAWMAARRLASPKMIFDPVGSPPVTLLVPVTQLDPRAHETLGSVFNLSYPHYNVIFCVPADDDDAVPTIRRQMLEHPAVAALLLIGRSQVTFNPKLDNLDKGWAAATTDWIIIADSNVMMPPDFVQQLFSVWGAKTGLSCSPPVGVAPETFWSDVECAFLNTFQARIQLAADTLGFGFAHGKAMLFNRSLLDGHAGLRTLSFEVAEDSAATKHVRARGLQVRLVDRPFGQPLARRTFRDVWHRHLRWAQLRRQSFPHLFWAEPLTTSLVPLGAALSLAATHGWSMLLAGVLSIALWLAVEAALAAYAGWPQRRLYLLACVVRDIMAIAIWVVAWFRHTYHWRANHVIMTDASPRAAD